MTVAQLPEAAPGPEAGTGYGPLDLFGDPFVRDPHRTLAELRRRAPVHRDRQTGLWLVSRHAEVRQVLLDPAAFRPDNAQHAVSALPVAALRVLARAGFSLPPALANNGGPSHAGLRRLVTRFFNAGRVADAVPVVAETAGELLAGVERRLERTGKADLVAGFAQPLPCRVMMRLLGVEGVDPLTLVRWSDDALELFWGRPSPGRQLELAHSVADFHRWLSARVAQAPASPGTLVGALAAHRLPDGSPLDAATAVAVCFFVLIAGQSTTGQLIAGVLRHALREPGAWARAADEPGFAEAWVEEVLRREPPVTSWRRVTAHEVELGGVRLPAGAPLLLLLLGTGSDPAVFAEPERLCPYRENIRHHLAFGAGRHRCPGASLARTEGAVALRAAARALPGLREDAGAGGTPMLGLLSFRAPLRVPVRAGCG